MNYTPYLVDKNRPRQQRVQRFVADAEAKVASAVIGDGMLAVLLFHAVAEATRPGIEQVWARVRRAQDGKLP